MLWYVHLNSTLYRLFQCWIRLMFLPILLLICALFETSIREAVLIANRLYQKQHFFDAKQILAAWDKGIAVLLIQSQLLFRLFQLRLLEIRSSHVHSFRLVDFCMRFPKVNLFCATTVDWSLLIELLLLFFCFRYSLLSVLYFTRSTITTSVYRTNSTC